MGTALERERLNLKHRTQQFPIAYAEAAPPVSSEHCRLIVFLTIYNTGIIYTMGLLTKSILKIKCFYYF